MNKVGYYRCVFRFVVVGFLIFFLFRILFMLRFGDYSAIASNMEVTWRLLLNAIRFDAQVLAYIFTPISLLMIWLLVSKNDKVPNTFISILKWYIVIVYTLVSLILMLDQQYYLNFKTHYSLVLFDFFKESPLVLTKSIWKEHPVLLFLGCISAIFIGLKYWSDKILSRPTHPNAKRIIAFVIGYFILLPIAIRGSVTTFPLRSEDIYISENREVNDCVPNGVFMLKKAFSEEGKQFELGQPQTILKEEGFSNINEAIATYYNIPVQEAAKKPLEEWIYKVTPPTANARKYNVVFIVVESWSNKLMDYSSQHANLLCSMEKHLKEDILFRHFQSAANGTINTLETITTNTPYQPLFTSKYRYTQLPTSIAEPFNENGYNTEFISGIELSWRNLFEVLPNLKFKRALGKYEILHDYPKATYNNTWGIYDHEMLRCVFDKLKKQRKPNFFLCLTSTSHTPFEFPQGYPLPPLNLTPKDMALYQGEESLVKEYLKGYQYSNKALGDFMTWIKSSPLAANTIVVITGDHNIRMILPYNKPGSDLYENSVPLYIYLPPALKKQVQIDTAKMGSHYDIIPTLAPLVLSKAKYFALGQNLFDARKPREQYYSINEKQTLGGNLLTSKQAQDVARARRAMLKCYFQSLFTEINKPTAKTNL
ncbi:sulfatase-like hydrolase/transferase [uncultured Acetobacteroides sp.]|uniref:LTA synthase family protein n=1 Tax=uncultured Acetobacteroides sp. TaxID=1760811 RepID=UPI0029F4B37C|nr:sulfatase-like hydrolase/transferase [uncultured Acetobacteroides sp.]